MKGADLEEMGIRGGKRRKEVRRYKGGKALTRREEESRRLYWGWVVAELE